MQVNDSDDDDAEQVAANEVSGAKYPLAHRCLDESEFKSVNQLESVLIASHETVMLMQKDQGVDPGTTHLLAASCKMLASDEKIQVVSGGEGDREHWKDMPATSLHPQWKLYRKVFVEEMDRRFKLSGHPGVHVLLCWKMNPSVDTTKKSHLFNGKSASFELMEGEYLQKLKRRSLVVEPVVGLPSPTGARTGAAGNSADGNSPIPTTPGGTTRTSALLTPKRRKLSVLGAMGQFKVTKPPMPHHTPPHSI